MRLIAALLLACALAGCSSSTAAPERKASSPAASQYRPGSADDAAIIASHIPGCTGAEAGDVGGNADLASTATCTLEAHGMSVFTWKAAGKSTTVAQLSQTHIAFAYGPKWTVIAEDGTPLATEKLLAAKVAAALGGAVKTT